MHFVGVRFVLIIIVGEFMERLAVCSGLISLLFLISYPSTFAGGQHGFAIKVFTSPDDQFWNNSVIIEGTHKVMLVDAQLTKASAEKVLREIKETKKPLSILYITHEHADHFLGLEVFKEAYPRVRIIANFRSSRPNQQCLSRENRQMEKRS
jgi:metal-dependent hydrolase (beta-lactamase superfamily II)